MLHYCCYHLLLFITATLVIASATTITEVVLNVYDVSHSEKIHLVPSLAWKLAVEGSGIWCNVGALIIRVGFGGILYYNYNKEPPKPYSNYEGPYSRVSGSGLVGSGFWALGLGPGFGFETFSELGNLGFKPSASLYAQ